VTHLAMFGPAQGASPGRAIDNLSWFRQRVGRQIIHIDQVVAAARSVFTWRGTDSVSVGSEETAVRVLDEEVTTDQTRWRNRYW
ncbi:YjbF family lipoprotein, partial [Salmonella enterica subsp. enterica serovar Anatum]|nr:YjbF family lipoprotein [Salmonella enterica subsp. enterica serovar Anatum]